jgi:hypothetical protein
LIKWTVERSSTIYWAGKHWPRLKWLGWVQPSPEQIFEKIFKKKSFQNLWFFSRIFLAIFLNISLYFYTIKLQIRY